MRVRAAAVTRNSTPPPHARGLLLLGLLLAALAAHAHPIVSTDINRHVSIRVADAALEIRYVYEMLEIAAIETARSWDADSDGVTSAAEREAFAQAWVQEVRGALHVALDDVRVPMTGHAVHWELGEGAFGLSTWKLTAVFSGELPIGAPMGTFTYEDRFRPEEIGWKEIVLSAAGRTGIATSSVSSRDRSYEMTDYEAMLALPNPDEIRAHAVLRFPWVAHVAPGPEEASVGTLSKTNPLGTAPDTRAPASGRQEDDRASRSNAQETGAGAGAHAPAQIEDRVSATVHAESPVQSGRASAWHYYAWPFFKLGVHHIATGIDHLLFLLGLMLFRQPMRRLVAVVTAFTLAHSLTLALAASGQVAAPGAGVELLIAASVAYVGLLTLLRPHSRHGPLLALGFGLVHGLGFAGALGDALAGMHGRDWLVALAGFNLGIEALQILLVLLVWPLLRALGRLRPVRTALSGGVLAAGAAWMVDRGVAIVG